MQEAPTYSLCIKPNDRVFRFDGRSFNKALIQKDNDKEEQIQGSSKSHYIRKQQIISGSTKGFSVLDAVSMAMTDSHACNTRAFDYLCYFLLEAIIQEEVSNMDGTLGVDKCSFNKREIAPSYTVVFHNEVKDLASGFIVQIDGKEITCDHTKMNSGFVEIINDKKHFVRIYPVGLNDGLDAFVVVNGRYTGAMIPYSEVEMTLGPNRIFVGHTYGLSLPGIQVKIISEIKELLESTSDFFEDSEESVVYH